MSGEVRRVREFVDEYVLNDGRQVYLAGRRAVGQSGRGRRPPGAVMDMSFANQALAAEYMLKNHTTLKTQVYSVPEAIDHEIARLKLAAMGVDIDMLTPEQEAYLNEWRMGT